MRIQLGSLALFLFAVFAVNAFACTSATGGSATSNQNKDLQTVASITGSTQSATQSGAAAVAR